MRYPYWSYSVAMFLLKLTMVYNFNFKAFAQGQFDGKLQTTLSNACFSIEMFEFQLKFHWSVFLRVQLTISQQRLKQWLGAEQPTSHFMNQCWLSSLMDICGTRWRWAKLRIINDASNLRGIISITNLVIFKSISKIDIWSISCGGECHKI